VKKDKSEGDFVIYLTPAPSPAWVNVLFRTYLAGEGEEIREGLAPLLIIPSLTYTFSKRDIWKGGDRKRGGFAPLLKHTPFP